MKITKGLKQVMQANSFIGMVAATFLIKVGLHVTLAWVGLAINTGYLVYWTLVNEENDDTTDVK